MPKCGVCLSPDRSAIEADRIQGLTLKQLVEKYPFSQRQIQYHLDQHWNKPRPEASADELQKRLDSLVVRCEELVTGADTASFSQKTKAITTLNSVMRTALQVAGMLKSLAPPGQVTHDFTQSYDYRMMIAKINEAVVCPDCRKRLLEAIHASS